MRHTQAVALELFERLGYGATTIEQVAAEAEISAPTIYRHFGTKERLVLWDEYDPLLLAAIGERLKQQPPLQAIRSGLVAALDGIYAQDAARLLRRARLLAAYPDLRAANAAVVDQLRRNIAALALNSPFIGSRFDAEILASTVVGTFEAAVEEWLRTEGRASLRAIFDEAFERLERLMTRS
ncbi:MAG: helix-turn-helix domain containing protein [Devosia sp.]|nr:helix-turn-helix domain containing protein [Devosia sp.]